MNKKYPDWRENVKCCLKQKGMRATDLAKKTGLADNFLSNYIGKRKSNHKNISELNFNLIAKALDLHPAELRYGIDLNINIQFYLKCYKAILKAAKIRKQDLTAEQKALATAVFYNKTKSTQIIQHSETFDVVDIIA